MITLLLIIPLIGSLILLLISEPQTYSSLAQRVGFLKYNDAGTSIVSGTELSTNEDLDTISSNEKQKLETKMKQIALTTSLINFFLSLYL